MDECGRGSLAGPLVAGAVIFLSPIEEIVSLLPAPLRDSKKLTKIQRQKIFDSRHIYPISFALESVSVEEINRYGIAWANKEVFLRLIHKMNADKYLVDGNIKFSESNIESVIHGDSQYPQIMLASILAKVTRDQTMMSLHTLYPHFNWANNSGYCTKEHLAALQVHGLSTLHRTIFANTALSNVH